MINNIITNTFTNIYNNFYWQMGQNESKSGLGSTLNWSKCFRDSLTEIIKTKDIKSILDCSCGDWNWMRMISDELPEYIGLDCVQEIIDNNQKKFSTDNIRFICSDMNSYMKALNEKHFDLVIIRHTLEHLPLAYAIDSVRLSKKISKYSFITSYSEEIQNRDLNFPTETYRPIYLGAEPFKSILGNPLKIYYDSSNFPRQTEKYAQMYFYEN